MLLSLDDLRPPGDWAARCAGRVLDLFETTAPHDPRPRDAIEGIRTFAAGGPRTARLRTLALAALAAAREVASPAAKAAARAACQAASLAYTHPLSTVEQARHLLSPAVYAALAREAIAGPDAATKELAWAASHAPPSLPELLRRFPPQPVGRTRLAILYHRLDTVLRTALPNA